MKLPDEYGMWMQWASEQNEYWYPDQCAAMSCVAESLKQLPEVDATLSFGTVANVAEAGAEFTQFAIRPQGSACGLSILAVGVCSNGESGPVVVEFKRAERLLKGGNGMQLAIADSKEDWPEKWARVRSLVNLMFERQIEFQRGQRLWPFPPEWSLRFPDGTVRGGSESYREWPDGWPMQTPPPPVIGVEVPQPGEPS